MTLSGLHSRRRFLALLGALTAGLTSCGPFGSRGPLLIGDDGTAASGLVAEMYRALLTAHGIHTRRTPRPVTFHALTSGAADLCPWYLGTALLDTLHLPPSHDAPQIYRLVKHQFERRFALTLLAQTGVNETPALALRRETAVAYNVHTVSDLTSVAGQMTFVGAAECMDRPDCLLGLANVYGIQFGTVIPMSKPAEIYQTLLAGNADVAQADATDPQIAQSGLALPVDDRHLWPPNYLAPVVRRDALTAYPAAAQVLNRLAPLLTTETMSQLKAQVLLNGQQPAAVARAFLQSNRLL